MFAKHKIVDLFVCLFVCFYLFIYLFIGRGYTIGRYSVFTQIIWISGSTLFASHTSLYHISTKLEVVQILGEEFSKAK